MLLKELLSKGLIDHSDGFTSYVLTSAKIPSATSERGIPRSERATSERTLFCSTTGIGSASDARSSSVSSRNKKRKQHNQTPVIVNI